MIIIITTVILIAAPVSHVRWKFESAEIRHQLEQEYHTGFISDASLL